MKKTMLGVIFLIVIALSGCSKDDFAVNTDHPPDSELSEYLSSDKYEFMGDGGYYHYYKTLDVNEQHNLMKIIISGEVKDNSFSTGTSDHEFQIELWVDSEKMVQVSSGRMLNESEFDRLILLKKPIVEGATWEFDAYDKTRQKQVVTGKIVKVDEERALLEIEYTTKSGFIENRIIEKNRGTTSLIKKVNYKDVVTYTGYHLIPVEVIHTNETDQDINYNTLKAIEIDFQLYEIIEGFNKRWVDYINNIDQSLLELIDEGSNAYNKVVDIKDESTQLNDYLGFKPYKLEVVDDATLVYVVEKFMVNDENHYNFICYEIIKMDDQYYISDFYLANP